MAARQPGRLLRTKRPVAFRPRLAAGLAFFWISITASFVSGDNRGSPEFRGGKPGLKGGVFPGGRLWIDELCLGCVHYFYLGSFCQALFVLRLVQDYIPEPEATRPSLRRRPASSIGGCGSRFNRAKVSSTALTRNLSSHLICNQSRSCRHIPGVTRNYCNSTLSRWLSNKKPAGMRGGFFLSGARESYSTLFTAARASSRRELGATPKTRMVAHRA
jgi:hypothetical protein